MAVSQYVGLLLAALSLSASSEGAERDSTAYVHREFQIDAVMFSYDPGKELDSYKSLGSGMGTARATLGFSDTMKGKSVMVEIEPRVKEGRFIVTVDLKPEEAKKA